MDTPLIIGHRGASASRPENTVAAFDQALVEGADGLELDLQITRDDQVVVFHDKTLSMLGLKHRRIGQYTRAQLRELDVGSWFSADYAGARILDLDEVLERYGQRTDLYLEIKPVAERISPERALQLARVVAARLDAHPDLHRIYVLSFSDTVLRTVREHTQAGLRCVRNLEYPAQLADISPERLAELHAICVDIRHFWPDDIAHVHDAARHVFCYTADSVKHLRVALELDVTGVITNRPAGSRALLGDMLSG